MNIASIRPIAVAPAAAPVAAPLAAPQHQLDALRAELANPFAFASEASCPWGKPQPKG